MLKLNATLSNKIFVEKTKKNVRIFQYYIYNSSIFYYINYKWLKLPTTIGLIILSLILIIPIALSETIFPEFYRFFCDIIVNADFKTLLFNGILSFLLFAGALYVILTWGGLRGGISIALALSLSKELSGDLILHRTYVIVLFSIIVQGLSIGSFVKRLYK